LIKTKADALVNKPIFALIVLLPFLVSLTVFACAQQTFVVPPLSEKTINVTLNQGESVKGTVSVTGGTGTGVDFAVIDPDGNKLLSYNYTSYTSFSFNALIAGTYALSFNNSFCSCVGGKNVELDYSVNGKPLQGSSNAGSNGKFSTLIIAMSVVVIAVAVAVVLLIRRLSANAKDASVAPKLPALSCLMCFVGYSLN
jgi:predicted phage tail protein